jgi:hypothetical protein
MKENNSWVTEQKKYECGQQEAPQAIYNILCGLAGTPERERTGEIPDATLPPMDKAHFVPALYFPSNGENPG